MTRLVHGGTAFCRVWMGNRLTSADRSGAEPPRSVAGRCRPHCPCDDAHTFNLHHPPGVPMGMQHLSIAQALSVWSDLEAPKTWIISNRPA